MSQEIRAVLWDFGGVVTSSPFEAFNRYEADRGLPRDFIRTVNSTNPDTNAWAQFESSRIDIDEFDRLFAEESARLGHKIPGRDIIALLGGDLRPAMVATLQSLKPHYLLACLTNNVQAGEGPGMQSDAARAARIAEVMGLFDVVVESSKVGMRKPQPGFYRHACALLDINPDEAVFLDDLGINLKPARAMGMHTIKVTDPEQALRELSAVLERPLP